MKKINLVILKFIAEDKHALTLSAVQHYITEENILIQHHDNSDDTIEWFQTEADHFMGEWADLYRLAGISNFIHMFTSGHFMWFIEYQHLHQLSQQGFESLNTLLNSFFFRQMQWGGFTAMHKTKSKMLLVSHWLQRRLLWL
jgi:hypothetical protein